MWEAEEKIESLPDGMIGLSEMHEYGYLKDDVLPLTKEGAREWHRLGERIYPLFQDGTAGDFASQEEIEQHDGIFESRLTHGVQFCWKRTKSIWKMSMPARMPH